VYDNLIHMIIFNSPINGRQ